MSHQTQKSRTRFDGACSIHFLDYQIQHGYLQSKGSLRAVSPSCNLYFLLAAVLSVMSLAPVSSTSPVALLVLVVGISMMKEAVEDWHRFMQDIRVNSRMAWKSMLEMEILFILGKNSMLEMLRLRKTNIFRLTMNLDGETNLKHKRCLEATLALNRDMDFTDFKATIRCEDPNPILYSFIGNLEYEDQLFALSLCQVLLRDSKLRNTDYVCGVVIFSGSLDERRSVSGCCVILGNNLVCWKSKK